VLPWSCEAILSLPRRSTYADYLAAEQTSESRLELIDGVIVAMAGRSNEHNAIAGRFAGAFAARVPPGCFYYTPDQRFWIAATARGRYSDGSIICGKPANPAHDAQATTNPLVIVDVLSPSSDGDDDGETRRDFQSLESLQAYVIAAQDARWVKVYRFRDGETFELPRLTRAIPIGEVDDGILDGSGGSLLR
jgi:Uma2 family endonuclease